MPRDDEFAAFVAARYRALVRTGLLLTGDTGHAEDLTQSALIRTYLSWGRLHDPANAEAYARRTLVRLAVKARQRRWTAETAELLNIPLGTVKSRAARGLASLRQAGLLDLEGGRHDR